MELPLERMKYPDFTEQHTSMAQSTEMNLIVSRKTVYLGDGHLKSLLCLSIIIHCKANKPANKNIS